MSIENAMLVKITVKRVGNGLIDRKASQDLAMEKGIDPRKCKVVKKILDHPKIQELNKYLGQAERDLKFLTSPWLDNGTRILSAPNYFKIVEQYNKHNNRINTLITEAEEIYPELISMDEVNLNDLYNPADYPRTLRERIGIDINFYPIPSSNDFRVEISADEKKLIKDKLDHQWKEAQNNMVTDLWKRLHKVVNTMSETLNKDNPKIYDSLTGNIKELVDIIPDMDLTKDPSLDAMRKECLRKLTNWSKESLKNPTIQKQVQKEAEALAQKMQGYF